MSDIKSTPEWPRTIVLKKPVHVGSERVAELKMREFMAGDICGVRITVTGDGLSFDGDALIKMGAAMAGVPPSTIKLLSGPDLFEVTRVVLPFLDDFTAG